MEKPTPWGDIKTKTDLAKMRLFLSKKAEELDKTIKKTGRWNYLDSVEKTRKTYYNKLAMFNSTKEQEEYLFKVAEAVLNWADIDYTDEEMADLVMLNLLEIK